MAKSRYSSKLSRWSALTIETSSLKIFTERSCYSISSACSSGR
jgi:hypothetical protein